jgi:hypothetical protein
MPLWVSKNFTNFNISIKNYVQIDTIKNFCNFKNYMYYQIMYIMNTKILFLAFALFSGSVLLSGCDKELLISEENSSLTILKSAGLPFVSGEATFNSWTKFEQYPEGIKKHVSFQARMMPDGNVKGSGVLHYIGGKLELKFDLRCMTISGNKAKLSGVITSTTDDPSFIGKWCFFMAVDNGEGSGAKTDQMSEVLPYLNGSYDCAEIPENIELWEIDGGNIQVKP